jgi:hypothetical protein
MGKGGQQERNLLSLKARRRRDDPNDAEQDSRLKQHRQQEMAGTRMKMPQHGDRAVKMVLDETAVAKTEKNDDDRLTPPWWWNELQEPAAMNIQ